jgi:integrase
MPPTPRGSINEHRWADGETVTYRLRLRALGRRHTITLGTNREGWNPARAQVELDRAMEQIRRGTWKPPVREVPEPAGPEPVTFHVFVSEWWAEKSSTVAPNTRDDYQWRLERYLVPFFKDDLVHEIDVARVDAFRRQLLADRKAVLDAAELGRPLREERVIRRGPQAGKRYLVDRTPLSHRSINMLLDLLAQVLAVAVEHGHLDTNPAAGKRRRLKLPKRQRNHLEAVEVLALLDAAGRLEREAREDHRFGRRALTAELVLAGPRISEACRRRWREIDLAHGRLVIPESKTQKGVREVELPLRLVEELREHRAEQLALGRPCRSGDFVYGGAAGGPRDGNRFRGKILPRIVELASELRVAVGGHPLPDGVTPHTLRRTAITLALQAGRDPRFVMDQVGHEDPRVTVGIYAQVTRRRTEDRDAVWELMRFADEPEQLDARNGTRFGTTEALGGDLAGRGGAA